MLINQETHLPTQTMKKPQESRRALLQTENETTGKCEYLNIVNTACSSSRNALMISERHLKK